MLWQLQAVQILEKGVLRAEEVISSKSILEVSGQKGSERRSQQPWDWCIVLRREPQREHVKPGTKLSDWWCHVLKDAKANMTWNESSESKPGPHVWIFLRDVTYLLSDFAKNQQIQVGRCS